MKKSTLKILSLLIIIVSILSVQAWLNLPLGTTILSWIVNFLIIAIIIRFYVFNKREIVSSYISSTNNKILEVYFFWLIICIIRGAFIAENYWEWKQLIIGIQSLSLPLFLYIFTVPLIAMYVLKFWFKYAIFIFVLICPFLSTVSYHFYLGPVFIVGCLIPLIPKKWMIILISLLVFMLFVDWGARSQVIKSAVVLLVAIGIYFRSYITLKMLKIAHLACYICPIVLLILGLSGTFNIFEGLSSNKGKYVEKKVVNGQVVEEDITADTRTFIYKEVIESALKHNYVIWGRTPARGNDSMTFGTIQAEELKTGKYERHGNELCHTNVFTWLGLIGLFLYSLIYLRSSYLAVYQSKNIYIKFIGCFIAFRWAYGWVEDLNNFSIMNISLWMMIAMGLSIKFRNMTNLEMKKWVQSIFKFNTKRQILYYANRNSNKH